MINEKWEPTYNNSAIVEISEKWLMVASLYGYGGSSITDADGLAERAALISAARRYR